MSVVLHGDSTLGGDESFMQRNKLLASTALLAILPTLLAPYGVTMFEKGVSDSSLPTQQSPLGTARSEEEFAAYKELFEPLSPEEVAKKAELFLRDYPNSGLSLFVRQAVVVAYEKLSDDTKLVVHAETLLKEQPDNLVVLTILARAYARMEQYDNAIDRAAAAIEYGKRLERPSQTTKPELRLELTRLTAENLATMGTAHLGKVLSKRDAPNETMIQQAGLHQAVENFHKALALNPSDGLSCYRLAIAYALQEDALNAVKFYARAVALGGPVAHVAEVNLTKVLRVMRRDLKEIPKLVREAKEEIEKEKKTEQTSQGVSKR